jgi:hypothetical protein
MSTRAPTCQCHRRFTQQHYHLMSRPIPMIKIASESAVSRSHLVRHAGLFGPGVTYERIVLTNGTISDSHPNIAFKFRVYSQTSHNPYPSAEAIGYGLWVYTGFLKIDSKKSGKIEKKNFQKIYLAFSNYK